MKKRIKIRKQINPLCKCGCGQEVSQYRGRWRKFILRHHLKTERIRKLNSKRMLNNKLSLNREISKETRAKIAKAQTGPGNSVWNGGRTQSGKLGYFSILCKDHPFADINGRVKEERLIMEKHLGRYLSLNEVVHHRNEKKSDNKIENLQVMTRYKHRVYHIKKTWEKRRKNNLGK